jgi:hypothetical protein
MNEANHSFLLRLWLERSDPSVWQAILENPINGERFGFNNREALFSFLEREEERLENETLSTKIMRIPKGDTP